VNDKNRGSEVGDDDGNKKENKNRNKE